MRLAFLCIWGIEHRKLVKKCALKDLLAPLQYSWSALHNMASWLQHCKSKTLLMVPDFPSAYSWCCPLYMCVCVSVPRINKGVDLPRVSNGAILERFSQYEEQDRATGDWRWQSSWRSCIFHSIIPHPATDQCFAPIPLGTGLSWITPHSHPLLPWANPSYKQRLRQTKQLSLSLNFLHIMAWR